MGSLKTKKNPNNPILIVDDEEQVALSNRMALAQAGFNNLDTCTDSRSVMEILKKQIIDLILLDLRMPYISGNELLGMINEEYPHIPVIIITGANDIETAVTCMKQGAFDFMVKPIDKTRLTTSVRRALEYFGLQQQHQLLQERLLSEELQRPEVFEQIITRNSKMLAIFRYLETIASTNQPLLINGETGVGKELIAKATHTLSNREGELVTINAASLDDSMFSDTLFGHKKGAFTGADTDRPGMIEKADGGTLFMDEIGDLGATSQVKLLRLLQEGEYMPLGSDNVYYSNARIVIATNRNLEDMVASGQFRKDLYFRLRSHHVHLPPLRERKDDLGLLLDYFLEKASTQLNKPKPTPPKELTNLLKVYAFPGNIRELEALVFEAVTQHKSKILSMAVFKDRIYSQRSGDDGSRGEVAIEKGIGWPEELPTSQELAVLHIEEALNRANGSQALAARLLGITPSALSQRLKKLNIK